MKRRELDRSKVPLLIDDLNRLLINYRNYCQKLKVFQQKGKFHNFFELHQHFVELYDKGHEYINEITIRIQVLNHYPVSALQNYLIFAEIEMPDNIRSIYQMIES